MPEKIPSWTHIRTEFSDPLRMQLALKTGIACLLAELAALTPFIVVYGGKHSVSHTALIALQRFQDISLGVAISWLVMIFFWPVNEALEIRKNSGKLIKLLEHSELFFSLFRNFISLFFAAKIITPVVGSITAPVKEVLAGCAALCGSESTAETREAANPRDREECLRTLKDLRRVCASLSATRAGEGDHALPPSNIPFLEVFLEDMGLPILDLPKAAAE